MNFPGPTEKQARLIWFALSGLAVAAIVALVVALVRGMGQVLDVLAPVIWPVAVAGVLAYLLDPVVDFLEHRHVPRTRAIVLVFVVAAVLVIGLFGSVLPRLVVETRQLVTSLPTFVARMETRASEWANKPHSSIQGVLDRFGIHWPGSFGATNSLPVSTNNPSTTPATPTASKSTSAGLFDQLDSDTMQKATGFVGGILKSLGTWLGNQFSRLTGLFGIIAGLSLIPIYLFYFLQEKQGIVDNWTDYVPGGDPSFKEEVVFVIRSINDYLIAFFRGQVLVAMCDGVLYGIGFAIIGLPYAFLIGVLAVALTIIPFVGAIITCGAALLIALVSYADWQHPLLVFLVFGIVQGIEGYVLQPKIIGNRVGLHPMVIIIAIMTGTTLLGGVLGGILAIPMAAALRVILTRYVWKKASA
jgi:predicted PurR-regulated permease PerM